MFSVTDQSVDRFDWSNQVDTNTCSLAPKRAARVFDVRPAYFRKTIVCRDSFDRSC